MDAATRRMVDASLDKRDAERAKREGRLPFAFADALGKIINVLIICVANTTINFHHS